MFQSSVLVQIFLGLLSLLERVYLHSWCHRMFQGMGRFLARIFRGSILGHLLYSLDALVYTSVTAKLWLTIYRFINTVIRWIQLRLNEAFEHSLLYQMLHGFKTISGSLFRIGILSLGFGMGLLVLYVLTHRHMGLVGFVFLVGGFLCLFFCQNTQQRLRSSLVIRWMLWILSFFLTDEEAVQWKQKK